MVAFDGSAETALNVLSVALSGSKETVRVVVFPFATVPDSELDQWMESRIYPAMTAIPALAGLITTMVTQGYEYRRDDDMALWSSADLTYSITYEM